MKEAAMIPPAGRRAISLALAALACASMLGCVRPRLDLEVLDAETQGGPHQGDAGMPAAPDGDGDGGARDAPLSTSDQGPTSPDLPGQVAPPCGPADGVCPPSCLAAMDVDCGAGPGATCTTALECASRLCVDGVCCSEQCGVCQRCSAPAGVCVPIPAGQPDDLPPAVCQGKARCDGQGACKKEQGEFCLGAGECQSGVCADAVCCDRTCRGACERCNFPGQAGTCRLPDGPELPSGCSDDSQICTSAPGCLSPDESCIGRAFAFSIHADPMGQVLTIRQSGRLVAVRFALHCDDGQEATLEIRGVSGLYPDQTVLHTQRVRGPFKGRIGPGNELLPLFALSPPLPVRSNQRIAIIVRFHGPSLCAVSQSRDCYAGGHSFAGRATSPGDWFTEQSTDIEFRTYVLP